MRNNERPPFEIHTATEAISIEHRNNGNYTVKLFQQRTQRYIQLDADVVILATGYVTKSPSNLLSSIEKSMKINEQAFPICGEDYNIYEKKFGKIYIQNAEINTHGFNAADLSLGPYRNACIINSILNKKYYDITNLPVFHQFVS
ncbi:SidA/IucD/PvdA family monooxygenase [Rhizosphaericola mali]|uniref:SidA/IucD/PvdA family monooxygenase n=1 Tax=Rhizosphaericola mali TaxID=2545455 RepID=UPI001CD98795|nr:SidA/IucD/PvdA family monooxygenase [Rhizosphaericola mali]